MNEKDFENANLKNVDFNDKNLDTNSSFKNTDLDKNVDTDLNSTSNSKAKKLDADLNSTSNPKNTKLDTDLHSTSNPKDTELNTDLHSTSNPKDEKLDADLNPTSNPKDTDSSLKSPNETNSINAVNGENVTNSKSQSSTSTSVKQKSSASSNPSHINKKLSKAKKKKKKRKRKQQNEDGFIMRLFSNNTFIKVFSIIVAFILWLLVALYISPEISKNIFKNEIVTDLSGTPAGELGLSIVEMDKTEVSLMIKGKRSDVAKLSKDDFIIKPNVDSITAPGTHSVDFIVTPKNPNLEIQIDGVNPDKINIRLDTISTATIPVVIGQTDIKVVEGLKGMTPYPSVTEIKIKGPASDVANIKDAYVQIPPTQQPLSETTAFTSKVVLRDAQGNKIDDNITKLITIEKDQIGITVPVHKEMTVPLKVNFINLPSGYDSNNIPFRLERETIKISGPPEKIDAITEIRLGTININDLRLGTEIDFPIQLETGLVNTENIETVKFTFNPPNYGTRSIPVKTFTVDNKPGDRDIKILDTVKYVTIIGEKSVLESIKTENLYGVIDLADQTIDKGSWYKNVTIKTTNNLLAWALGEYSVTIKVT